MMEGGVLSDYQAKPYAYELDRSYACDHVGKLAGLLFDAQVEPKPHQVDAALFALRTPFTPGVILADEVGLGRTIEAGIVISQYWAEHKRCTLIIVPSSLRQQWRQELDKKFAFLASLLERGNLDELLASNAAEQVLICSHEFANSQHLALTRHWDLVVCDEAYRLRAYWTGQAKIVTNVACIYRASSKTVMLTATPLQSRLEEFYGLMAVFDPDFFCSLDTFKERYIKNPGGVGNDDLSKRIAQIAKHTLRRDADKYIRFITHMPPTVAFNPSQAEVELYEKVNAYLQRPFLWAFSKSQRHLSALVARKRLGSSSYAVTSMLASIAARLETEAEADMQRNDAGGFTSDPNLTGEEREDAQESNETGTTSGSAPLSGMERESMLAEAAELRSYADLARSITANQKAVKLVDVLGQGFDRLREIGAPEKATIFTDSTIIQDYLARSLAETGWGEGVVMFDGANNSAYASQIYQAWLKENGGSDLITGILATDRRRALVDEFRKRGRLMITTETVAEGINLQFYSMPVNYDLPWNPQCVEQRIGRVHRFGQKHNVIVVSFSNKGSVAGERILQLLTEEFKLFISVFGASDEVLGQIEDGLDFKKNIAAVLERYTTAEQIEEAFNELEARYSAQIDREMKHTREKVFDNLDPEVRGKLKFYDAQTGVVLNTFERLLIDLTRHELGGYASFNDTDTQFTLTNAPAAGIPTGNCFFKSQSRTGAHQYRYASDLIQWVVTTAKTRTTPPAHLVFQTHGSDRATAIAKRLRGRGGRISAHQVTFTMQAADQSLRETYLLLTGFFADGTLMDQEQVRDLPDLNCVSTQPNQVNTQGFEDAIEQLRQTVGVDVQERNATFYLQQKELIDAACLDLKAIFDAKIRDYHVKETTVTKAARKAKNTAKQLKLIREARSWRHKVEKVDDEYRRQRGKLRDESDAYLDKASMALEPKEETSELFAVSWEVL